MVYIWAQSSKEDLITHVIHGVGCIIGILRGKFRSIYIVFWSCIETTQLRSAIKNVSTCKSRLRARPFITIDGGKRVCFASLIPMSPLLSNFQLRLSVRQCYYGTNDFLGPRISPCTISACIQIIAQLPESLLLLIGKVNMLKDHGLMDFRTDLIFRLSQRVPDCRQRL